MLNYLVMYSLSKRESSSKHVSKEEWPSIIRCTTSCLPFGPYFDTEAVLRRNCNDHFKVFCCCMIIAGILPVEKGLLF